MIDEELILSGVNRKNEKAWASLYDHYYAALCAYVNRILKGSESTEDLVQEVLLPSGGLKKDLLPCKI